MNLLKENLHKTKRLKFILVKYNIYNIKNYLH